QCPEQNSPDASRDCAGHAIGGNRSRRGDHGPLSLLSNTGGPKPSWRLGRTRDARAPRIHAAGAGKNLSPAGTLVSASGFALGIFWTAIEQFDRLRQCFGISRKCPEIAFACHSGAASGRQGKSPGESHTG